MNMRRGRLWFTAATAVAVAFLAFAGAAFADDSQTMATGVAQDATVQGYGGVGTQTPPPPEYICVGLDANGNKIMVQKTPENANTPASACTTPPAAPAPEYVCVGLDSHGNKIIVQKTPENANTPASACTPPTVSPAETCTGTGANGQPVSGTPGASGTSPASCSSVQGAQHTVQHTAQQTPTCTGLGANGKPVSGVAGAGTMPASCVKGAQFTKRQVAPAQAQTLPFTGLQLTVFAVLGIALLGGGLLLRRAARD
jgi:hypothetical protein